jgi:quercetin dioxygenase-like cupin family protein
MVAPTLAPPPPTAEPLPASLLADIAAGIAQVPDAWRHLVCHDPDERRPVRLLATEAYEVWVIGWTRGQHVRPHDHGHSAAAVLVVDGELTEVDLLGNRRQLVAGGVLQLVPGVVHDVLNQRDQPATSVHVYSPPLTEMTYYDTETWEPEEIVHVDQERPVLAGWRGANLLHPARRRPS